MQRSIPVAVLGTFLLPVLLAGCGADTARNLGLTRDAPDEFQVTTRAPLSMPPSLGELPVPRPGAPRPQEVSARQQAESTLVPGATGTSGPGRQSSGEQALLGATGRDAPGDIRSRVDEESLRLERTDRTVVDRALFWRETPPPGIPVDPAREAQRLRENAALGRDPVEGETPVIQPQRRGLFSGLRFW